MQKLIIRHGERRCALNIDAKLYAVPDPGQEPKEGERKPAALQLAVIWPGQQVALVPFVGKVELELKVAESSPDSDVKADVPCMIENCGPHAIRISSAGRYRGMVFPLEVCDTRSFALNVFDDAERLEISVVGEAAAATPAPVCDRVPCDMVDGICPRCETDLDREKRIAGEQAARDALLDARDQANDEEAARQSLEDTGPQS